MNLISRIRRDKYYLLLFVQVLFLLIMPFLPIHEMPTPVYNVFGLVLIVLAGLNVIGTKRFKNIGRVIAILFIVLTLFVEFGEYPWLYFFTFILFFSLFLLVDARIIRMLIDSEVINSSLIAGSIAGYLMIGISFAFFIISFSAVGGEVLSESLDVIGFHGIIYYAFTTITTIGYGEITPTHPVIQTVSVMTGVLSQFYMAVVVAVIVGKLMRKEP